MERWPAIAVMGAGAVGSFFGGMLARSGARVTLIGRPPHVAAVMRDGLVIERATSRETIRMAASTDVAVARDAEIVLFCVKSFDTENAAKMLAPYLARETIVISIQNGVDNVSRIREISGVDAIAAAVYVAVELPAPGTIRHFGRGDLLVGELPGGIALSDARSQRRCDVIASLFVRAGVPCKVSNDITADLWTKLVMNCAYNAISALSRTRYGPLVSEPLARDLMAQVVHEILAIAPSCGVRMPRGTSILDDVWRLADGMPGAISSMAQDLAGGRRTEIDSLNGYVTRRGAEFGIPTPVNRTLLALVKLLENARP